MARSLKFGNRLSGGTSRQAPWLLEHVHSDPAQPRSHKRKNAGFQGRRVYASLGRCGPTPTTVGAGPHRLRGPRASPRDPRANNSVASQVGMAVFQQPRWSPRSAAA